MSETKGKISRESTSDEVGLRELTLCGYKSWAALKAASGVFKLL